MASGSWSAAAGVLAVLDSTRTNPRLPSYCSFQPCLMVTLWVLGRGEIMIQVAKQGVFSRPVYCKVPEGGNPGRASRPPQRKVLHAHEPLHFA